MPRLPAHPQRTLFLTFSSDFISSIPVRYLDEVETAVVDGEYEGQVTEISLPRLRKLYVRDWFGHYEPLRPSLSDQQVVDEILSLPPTREAMQGNKMRIEQGRMRFQVLFLTTLEYDSGGQQGSISWDSLPCYGYTNTLACGLQLSGEASGLAKGCYACNVANRFDSSADSKPSG